MLTRVTAPFMGAMTFDAQIIRDRLGEIDGQIDHHEFALKVLRSEREDYAATLRVLARHLDLDDVTPVLPKLPESLSQADGEAYLEHGGVILEDRRKPPGTPAVPAMILAILRENRMSGGTGLEPKKIAAEIRERWWRDAPSKAVAPIVWRMWDQGKLDKHDGLYFIPKEKPSAEPTANGLEGRSGPLFEHPPQ